MLRSRILVFILLYVVLMCVLLYKLEAYYAFISLWWGETPIKRLKIYMYPLGPHLNTDIIQVLGQKNPNIMNTSGLGTPLNISEFVFDTNQYALEQYFYYRLTHSQYLTTDPTEADLFYLPFFPNLAKVADQYTKFSRFRADIAKNFSFINETSRKHFIVYGGVQQYAQAFRGEVEELLHVVMLEQNGNKFNKTDNITIAPYPSQIHFRFNASNVVEYDKKDILVSSAWNSRYRVRAKLVEECRRHKNVCVHIELRANSDVYNHTRLYEITTRSVFCLSPHGDSTTRSIHGFDFFFLF
eukprot:Phypoly_transcript_05802.p1 GENE.Phypoly_transcript_05802~~Phypoly_transcript_05802.p1  ORF type:complete len:298 (+),score=3.14 Phypoly_transcript_05802:207-1100(+)